MPLDRFCPRCGNLCPQDAQQCPSCHTSLKTTLPLSSAVPTNPPGGQKLPVRSSTDHLLPGQLIHNRYLLLERVGVGGFGAVYKAEDTQQHGALVAVKEIGLRGLRPQQIIEATGSFNREASLLTTLKHPNIPRFHAQFTDPDHWYLVMDFIAGETLETLLSKVPKSRLSLEETLRIGLQLCNVLEYLHTRQPAVIFRDLKPANIMLLPNHTLYLIDFGVARLFQPGKAKDTIAFGSPGYAAPEQYGRAQTTPAADIYSLGVTLYQLLTGLDPSLTPFRFAPLRLFDPTLPASLEYLLRQMLELAVDHRPQQVSQVKRTLQKISVQSLAHTPPSRSKHGGRKIRAVQTPSVATPASPAFSTQGVTVSIYRGHRSPVFAVAWSPDGISLASGGQDRSVHVWDALTGSHPLFYRNHSGTVFDLAWDPRLSGCLATGGADHTVQIWQARREPRWLHVLALQMGLRYVSYEHSSSVNALSWSPDGRAFAAAEEVGAVRVWDVQAHRKLFTYHGHSDVAYAVAWSPDGQRIASSSVDHSLRVWYASSGEGVMLYRNHASVIHALSWSPDGRYLAFGGANGSVYVWEVTANRKIFEYRKHKDSITSLGWSPDGRRIASGSLDETVHVWDAFDGAHSFIYSRHSASIRALVWSPDSSHLASTGDDATVHVWKTL